MEPLKYNSYGQWSLEKAVPALKAPLTTPTPSTIPAGNHEIEIHPHIDHLKRIKGHIQDSGKGSLKMAHLKQAGFDKNFLKNHLPKDATGSVSPDMIDKHIEGLPKHKVIVKVAPYEMASQMHSPNSQQHVISVNMHPEHKKKMDEQHRNTWNTIKDHQHLFGGLGGDPSNKPQDHDQVGWARVDANAKPGHWHVDEIQSDFQNADKIASKLSDASERDASAKDTDIVDLHNHLSHGHEDPQHMIHSAVNELGRKYGVKSTSMDTPEDQAKQSFLREYDDDRDSDLMRDRAADRGHDARYDAFHGDASKHLDANFKPEHFEEHAEKHPNKYLRDAFKKLGHEKTKDLLKQASAEADPEDELHRMIRGWTLEPNGHEHLKDLSNPEKDALHEFIGGYLKEAPRFDDDRYADIGSDVEDEYLADHGIDNNDEESDEKTEAKLPVHQIDTYKKRPKKLGFKDQLKSEVLGESEHHGKDQKVQYSKLHKSEVGFLKNGQWKLS